MCLYIFRICKCVGLVDGTTFPLTQRPPEDGEVYFDRKKRYSIKMQIVCDDRKKIIHMFTGFLGTVSDVVCIQNFPLWQFRDDPRTFSDGEYFLGDSGYPGLHRVVPAFRYGVVAKDPDKEDFNFCIAKTRVSNEHCIGILKSRWHSLKEIKTQLKNAHTSAWMVKQIECCVRLHNYVHDLNDEWGNEDEEIVLENEDDAEIAENVDGNNTEGSYLRSIVMEESLEHNRRPGGFLA